MSPDRRKHRGPHPEDRILFADPWIPVLRTAVTELSWLLSRDYPPRSSLKLVGDRHGLRERQRTAVGRSACSDGALNDRLQHRVETDAVNGEAVAVDGFNVIVSVEAALADGIILRCRDGTLRDMASVHGSYRQVDETRRAVALIAEALTALAPGNTLWLLDRPVSNSGRLAKIVNAEAARRGLDWTVELVNDPDTLLKASDCIVATSDSAVLDHCGRWLSLTRLVIDTYISDAWMIDLNTADQPPN